MRVNYQRTDPNRLRRGRATQQSILEKGAADAAGLMASIDREASENHDGNRSPAGLAFQ